MDDDMLDMKDDPNRYYCVSFSSGRVHPEQPPDGAPNPQYVSRSVPEGKLGCSPGLLTIIQSDTDRPDARTTEPVQSDTGDRGFTIDSPRLCKSTEIREQVMF